MFKVNMMQIQAVSNSSNPEPWLWTTWLSVSTGRATRYLEEKLGRKIQSADQEMKLVQKSSKAMGS